MITCSAASAQTVAPFSSDGCVPGYTAQGQFVDEQGTVLESAGWTVTADQNVLDGAGQKVFLKKSCVGNLGANKNVGLIRLGLGALVLGLAAGGTSSTGSTTGTVN
jgi:hypothetical protein